MRKVKGHYLSELAAVCVVWHCGDWEERSGPWIWVLVWAELYCGLGKGGGDL